MPITKWRRSSQTLLVTMKRSLQPPIVSSERARSPYPRFARHRLRFAQWPIAARFTWTDGSRRAKPKKARSQPLPRCPLSRVRIQSSRYSIMPGPPGADWCIRHESITRLGCSRKAIPHYVLLFVPAKMPLDKLRGSANGLSRPTALRRLECLVFPRSGLARATKCMHIRRKINAPSSI